MGALSLLHSDGVTWGENKIEFIRSGSLKLEEEHCFPTFWGPFRRSWMIPIE